MAYLTLDKSANTTDLVPISAGMDEKTLHIYHLLTASLVQLSPIKLKVAADSHSHILQERNLKRVKTVRAFCVHDTVAPNCYRGAWQDNRRTGIRA